MVPFPRQGTISRPRLVEILDKHKSCKLVVLNAALGFGKTVLLTEYIKTTRLKYAWLTCSSEMSDLRVFLLYLITALQRVIDNFGEVSLAFLSTYKVIDVKDFVTVFLNELESSLTEQITLIIDDFYLVESTVNPEKVSDFLNELLNELPFFLRLLISTRQGLRLKTERLKGKRDYFEVGNDILRVSNSEVKETSAVIYRRPLNDFEVEKIQKICNGWFTPIHFMLQKETIGISMDSLVIQDVNAYLSEDFFETIKPELRSFLLLTAQLIYISPKICRKITGKEYSNELINDLVSKNIFLEKTGETEYSYQKLFKAFIVEKQKLLLSASEFRELYLNSSEILEEEKQIRNAIDLCIIIGAYDRASDLLYKYFKEIISEGYLTYCYEIVKILHEKYDNGNDNLNYVSCLLKVKYLSEISSAMETLDLYSFDSKLHENPLFQGLLLLKAECKILVGDYDSAILILKAMLSFVFPQNVLCEIYYQLGRAYLRKGPSFYLEAIDLLEGFLAVDSELILKEMTADILNILGIIYFDSGNFLKAIFFFEKVLKLGSDLLKRSKSLDNLVISFSKTAQYTKAKEIMNVSDILVKQIPFQSFKFGNAKSHEHLSFSVGDYQDSILYNKDMLEQIEKSEDHVLKWTLYYSMAESYYYWFQYALATQSLDYCIKNSHKMPEPYQLSCKYLDSRLTKGILGQEAGFYDILEYHKKNHSNQNIALFEFVLGSYYASLGKHDSAAFHISSALKMARELSYKYFLLNEIPISRIAFDFAIANNIEKNFVFALYDEFRDRANLPWLSDEAKTRLALESRKLTDIRFSPFGNTEFYLRGEKISEDKWIRKKSKVLLAYLMSDPGRVYTKDVIMDMFFDDIPQAKADTMYHSTIYNIRTALKIYTDTAAGEKKSRSKAADINPQYIVYEDKTLRLNPDFYYVSENDEFEKYCAKVQHTHSSDEEKITAAEKAAGLYKGDFMPGYYDGWCEELRVKYKNLLNDTCSELVSLLEKNKRPEDVIKYAAMLINEDKLNDSAYIKMIKAYSSLGSKAMAVSCYNTMLKNFEEELGEKPHQKSLAEIRSILDS